LIFGQPQTKNSIKKVFCFFQVKQNQRKRTHRETETFFWRYNITTKLGIRDIINTIEWHIPNLTKINGYHLVGTLMEVLICKWTTSCRIIKIILFMVMSKTNRMIRTKWINKEFYWNNKNCNNRKVKRKNINSDNKKIRMNMRRNMMKRKKIKRITFRISRIVI